MTSEQFYRLVNNFYTSKNLVATPERLNLDAELLNYISEKEKTTNEGFKVAFVFICLNPLYWQYAPAMVNGAKQMFLPGHKTDYFFWTDIPENPYEIYHRVMFDFQAKGKDVSDPSINQSIQQISDDVHKLRSRDDVKIIPTEPVEWPYPTLLRYNLFLQEEQKLKEYDYIFYCDVDMQFVNIVGDEILGEGLTAAQHPMYALKKQYYPPYEPNPQSASFINRPGKVITEGDKQRFMPLYYAGGFQGGKSAQFIQAMKDCRELIDKDLNKGYIPIWNDESVWNKYLSENPPEIVLSPAYIYPDSLIEEYYKPLWGQDYPPKLKTLTKWFTTSQEGGQALKKMLGQ